MGEHGASGDDDEEISNNQNAARHLHVRFVTKDAHREATSTIPQKAKVSELKGKAVDTFGVSKEGTKLIDHNQHHLSLEDKYDRSLDEASLLDGQHVKFIPEDAKTDGEGGFEVAPSSPMTPGPGPLAVLSPEENTYPKQSGRQAGSSSNFGSSGRGSASQNVALPAANRESGQAGLSNLGNTCFMNSSLQCLAHTVPLMRCFLTGVYTDDLNRTNPLGMHGELAEAFGQLMDQLWQGGIAHLTPRNFKESIGRFAPQFSGYAQHDSQEFLAFLLDGLHEDLNRIKNKPYIEEKDSNNRPDEELAAEAWSNYRLRNNSFIVDHFQGLYKSTLDCPQCGVNSAKFDPFMYLSLPLPESRNLSLTLHMVHMDGSQHPTKYVVEVPSSGTVLDVLVALARTANLPVSYPPPPTKPAAKGGGPAGTLAAAPADSEQARTDAGLGGFPKVEGVLVCAKVARHYHDELEVFTNLRTPVVDIVPSERFNHSQSLVAYYYSESMPGPMTPGALPVVVHHKHRGRYAKSFISAPLLLWIQPHLSEESYQVQLQQAAAKQEWYRQAGVENQQQQPQAGDLQQGQLPQAEAVQQEQLPHAGDVKQEQQVPIKQDELQPHMDAEQEQQVAVKQEVLQGDESMADTTSQTPSTTAGINGCVAGDPRREGQARRLLKHEDFSVVTIVDQFKKHEVQVTGQTASVITQIACTALQPFLTEEGKHVYEEMIGTTCGDNDKEEEVPGNSEGSAQTGEAQIRARSGDWKSFVRGISGASAMSLGGSEAGQTPDGAHCVDAAGPGHAAHSVQGDGTSSGGAAPRHISIPHVSQHAQQDLPPSEPGTPKARTPHHHHHHHHHHHTGEAAYPVTDYAAAASQTLAGGHVLTADGHTLSCRSSHQDLRALARGSHQDLRALCASPAPGSSMDAGVGPAVEPFNMWGQQEDAAAEISDLGPPFRLLLSDDKGDTAFWKDDPTPLDDCDKVDMSWHFALEWADDGGGVIDLKAMEQPVEHHTVVSHAERARDKKTVKLTECVEAFLQPEQLSENDSWYCQKCKAHVQADKKLDLWSLPEVLVVHLKRFQFTKHSREKLETNVSFDTELDLRPYVRHFANQAQQVHDGTHQQDLQNGHAHSQADIPIAVPHYSLCGVVNHYGSLGGGHYTAYAKLPGGANSCSPMEEESEVGDATGREQGKRARWFCFDDSYVTALDEDSVCSPAAYLLFYRRTSDAMRDEQDPALLNKLCCVKEQRREKEREVQRQKQQLEQQQEQQQRRQQQEQQQEHQQQQEQQQQQPESREQEQEGQAEKEAGDREGSVSEAGEEDGQAESAPMDASSGM